MQKHDQVLNFTIPYSKILNIVILDECLLMVIHHDYEYTVVRLANPKSECLGNGQLPRLCSSIKKYERNKIIYLNNNRLQIYNWIQKQITFSITIPYSHIYQNIFNYFITNHHIIYWKQSSFKFEQVYSYQVQLLSRKKLCALKKWRFQYKSVHNYVLTQNFDNPYLIVFQAKGYTINVFYPDLNICHELKSIYHLLLVSKQINKQCLHLKFTYNQLTPDTTLCYQIYPHCFTKFYSNLQPINQIVYSPQYSIVLPNLISCYSQQKIQIQVKIRYKRKLKMLIMLKKLLDKETQQQFCEQFLKQFVQMI